MIDKNDLNEMLALLHQHEVVEFVCPDFSVKFKGSAVASTTMEDILGTINKDLEKKVEEKMKAEEKFNKQIGWGV